MRPALLALLLAGCGSMPAAVDPGSDAAADPEPQDAHVAGLDATGAPDAAAPGADASAPDEPDAAAPGADAGPPCGVDEHSPCCAGVPYDQACAAPRLCYMGPHNVPWCETRGMLGNVCADNSACDQGLTCYLDLCLACGFPGTACCNLKDKLTPCGVCAGYCYGGHVCVQGEGCQ